MKRQQVSRRTVLKGGGTALAGLTMVRVAGPVEAFPGPPGQDQTIDTLDDRDDSSQALQRSSGQVIPWLDQPPPSPVLRPSPETSSYGRNWRRNRRLLTTSST